MFSQNSSSPNPSIKANNPKPHPNPSVQRLLCWISTGLLIMGCCWIMPYGDFRQVGTVPQFWIGATIMSVGFLLSWRLQFISARWFWGVAIATRLLLLLMYPGDDIWRYLWEGHIQTLGLSPYHFAPEAPELVPYHTDWWILINHRNTSAIYPPVTQWGFRFLAMITPSVWLFKLAFTLADLGMCWGLSRRFGYLQTVLYAWNPLILYSFAGGGHYDIWFLLPLVAAWLVFDHPESIASDNNGSATSPPSSLQKKWGLSAFLIGISIAVKWISLPALGFLLWHALRQPGASKKGWLKRWGLIVTCGALPLLVTAIPFCTTTSCPLIPVRSGFVSYGRSAELVPYFVELVWPVSLKENWLFAFPLGLSVLWLLRRSPTFLTFIETYFTFLLLLSPVIHAWYFSWLIPFAVASQNLGTRFVSMSAFIYFVLQHRIALDEPWLLTPMERIILWCPFILGWLWTVWKNNTGVSYSNLRENSGKKGPQHGSIHGS